MAHHCSFRHCYRECSSTELNKESRLYLHYGSFPSHSFASVRPVGLGTFEVSCLAYLFLLRVWLHYYLPRLASMLFAFRVRRLVLGVLAETMSG